VNKVPKENPATKGLGPKMLEASGEGGAHTWKNDGDLELISEWKGGTIFLQRRK